MQRGRGGRPGCAVARARTVGDIYPPPAAWCPPGRRIASTFVHSCR